MVILVVRSESRVVSKMGPSCLRLGSDSSWVRKIPMGDKSRTSKSTGIGQFIVYGIQEIFFYLLITFLILAIFLHHERH